LRICSTGIHMLGATCTMGGSNCQKFSQQLTAQQMPQEDAGAVGRGGSGRQCSSAAGRSTVGIGVHPDAWRSTAIVPDAAGGRQAGHRGRGGRGEHCKTAGRPRGSVRRAARKLVVTSAKPLPAPCKQNGPNAEGGRWAGGGGGGGRGHNRKAAGRIRGGVRRAAQTHIAM